MMSKWVLVAIAGAVGVVVALGVTGPWGPLELGLSSPPSDAVLTVRKDPSWLDYLPGTSSGATFQLGAWSDEGEVGSSVRLISLHVGSERQDVGLCFAATRAELEPICGRYQVLGRIARDVDKPWVAQQGTSGLNFLALLSEPAPTLKQAAYLND